MKFFTLTCLTLFLFIFSSAQQVTGKGDPAFPVTNAYESFWSGNPPTYPPDAGVADIVSYKGKYYMFGVFSSLCRNSGSALVLDTTNYSIKNDNKWRINGTVYASIPDGKGGFYIGGDFSKIGDSSRKFIAQIHENGEPTSWNPKVDSTVLAMSKRGDTLFFTGKFTSVLGKLRVAIAMYSISGDSLFKGGAKPMLSTINSFLFQKDTLILGGSSGTPNPLMVKYCYKKDSLLNWKLQDRDVSEVRYLQFSQDSSTILFTANSNIKGVSIENGATKFVIQTTQGSVFSYGTPYGLLLIGNRAYAIGDFTGVYKSGSHYFRQGIFTFDDTSGTILPATVTTDGKISALHLNNNKMLLSGTFTNVNGVNRMNFASLDLNTFQPDSLQISPSDPIITMAHSGKSLFIAGVFTGINAVPRKDFAAIDSATNTILPWVPKITRYGSAKKMMIKGDTLFLLRIYYPGSCVPDDYRMSFKIYSLTTGNEIPAPANAPDDFAIDGNYMYVSEDLILKRFLLPSFMQDNNWGFNFTYYGYKHNPMHLMIGKDSIYSVGDNRFIDPCTSHPARRAYLITYDKKNGQVTKFRSYEGKVNIYDYTLFTHATFIENKVYIQGKFNMLNGVARNNFVALDIHTGAITNWNPPGPYPYGTSELQLFKGNLWFGIGTLNGVNAVDTVTGNPVPTQLTVSGATSRFPGFARRFIFTDRDIVIAGRFDTVNSNAYSSLVRFSMQVPVVTNYWIGSVSSSWENPLNWSTGQLPDYNTEVFINKGPVVLSSNTTIRSLEIASGVNFSVSPGYTLTIIH
jgi:hypothetical protein